MDSRQSAPIGRPRGFDADEALEKAMLVFWERGYDGVSLTDLARAMGITKTSLYAAFGNKDDLFRKSLELYAAGPAAYGIHALEQPTAVQVATAYLAGSVRASTNPAGPAGCMAVQSFVAANHLDPAIQEALSGYRTGDHTRLRDRFRRAVEEGDLPPEADPSLLARHLMATADGIAVQAAGGVPPAELQRIADAVLRNWPLL